MIKALLTLRLKQIYRALSGLGFFRAMFIVVLAGLLGLFLYVKASDAATSQFISGVFLILILLIHAKREDKLFLKSHFSNYKMLILSEYVLLALPFIVVFIIHQQWISVISFLGLLIIINIDIKPKYSSLNTKIQALIPSDSIEWKAGLRKHFFIIIPVWLIAMLTSFFIGSVPVAIFIIAIITISFYEECEPLSILMSYELSSAKLLLLKIKRQIQLFSLLILPLIGLFLIFHPGRWYIPVIEYLIFSSLNIYVIVTKYTFFEPNKKSPAAQTLEAIGILSGLIPIFLPVVWILTAWLYIKSKNKLKYYLDDYNS
jgi:hypothetical protein